MYDNETKTRDPWTTTLGNYTWGSKKGEKPFGWSTHPTQERHFTLNKTVTPVSSRRFLQPFGINPSKKLLIKHGEPSSLGRRHLT